MSDRNLTIEKRGPVTCILFGRAFENLDETALDSIRAELLEASSKADPPRVLIDLSHTKFFGSSFIEVLFRTWNRLNGMPEGRFGISGLTEYCCEVLQVTHLDRLWKLYPTLDQGVEELSAG